MIASWQAPEMDSGEESRLLRWLPLSSSEGGVSPVFEVAGYQRNLIRHAEAWGPLLLARLVELGALEPEGNPLDALDSLRRL